MFAGSTAIRAALAENAVVGLRRVAFGDAVFEARRITRQSHDGACTVSFDYPVAISIGGHAAPAGTNESLRRFGTAFSMHDFFEDRRAAGEDEFAACERDRRTTTALMKHAKDGMSGALDRATFTYDAVSSVTYARGGFASIARDAYYNWSPSAHPNSARSTLLVDLRSGRTFGYGALIRTNPRSIAALDALIRVKLRVLDRGLADAPDRPGRPYGIGPGGRFLPEGYGIDVTRAGFHINNLFDIHALAGVAVDLSRAELTRAGVLRTDGPLRALLGY